MKGAPLGSKENTKGQVTIFVILALVIVVAGVLIYFFYPNIISTSNSLEENPKIYFQNCIEDTLRQNVETLSSQGGSITPGANITYKGEQIEYLCYTNEYYTPCVIQVAPLIFHIESELKNSLTQKVNECFDSMKADYQYKGYQISSNKGEFSVDLLPKKVIIQSNSTLTLSKDSTQKYESFEAVLDNNLYELASISRMIVSWEAVYGGSEPMLFMSYYPKFNIKKNMQSDGTNIYIIIDTETGDKFQFASRSLVQPLGVAFS